MEPSLVAKITACRMDEKLTRTGAAYPIGDSLLLTARHVVEFPERDKTKPLTVEWQAIDEGFEIEPQAVKFAYDGGEPLDVVLLCYPLPTKVAGAVSHAILETEEISPAEWEAIGFPEVNGFNAQGATGKFGADQGKPAISLNLEEKLDPKFLKANNIDNGWGGMSGAPVFCRKTKKLQAVITDLNQMFEKQLIGVSIPYLMQLPEFRAALGLNASDEQHQKYLAELPQRIIELLQQIEESLLYQKLAHEFIPQGNKPSPAYLREEIKSRIMHDPISLLDHYRNIVETVLESESIHINDAQNLFLLFLGFFSKPGDMVEAKQVFQPPVTSRLAVEIHLAARYGLTPDLVYEPKDEVEACQWARGRFAIDGETAFREVGWQPAAIADELAVTANIAVNKVQQAVPAKPQAGKLGEFALKFLNDTIKNRRKGKKPQLIRLEVPIKATPEPTHPLHNDEVCAALYERLPNLPIVRYGSEFTEMEVELCTQVSEFFRIIQQYHQNP